MRQPAVLIVEDERAIRALLEFALSGSGTPIFQAASGAEALALYQQHRLDIGVALIDVQMPEMDGPQVLAGLRAINPQVRAVFMSGHTGRYSAQELLDLGAVRVLAKPFTSLAGVVRILQEIARGELAAAAESSAVPMHGPALLERRRGGRHEGLPLPILLATPDGTETAGGVVLNRSSQGLGVRVDRGTPAGAILHVRPELAPATPWLPVEVRHCRPRNQHWMLGCRFVNVPSPSDLLLFGYQATPA
jgi:CheY-like chemotaxis protein